MYAGPPSLQSPFDAALWAGMSRPVDELGLNMMAMNLLRVRRDGETFSQAFRRLGVRGCIVRSISSTRDITEKLIAEQFPMVVVSDRDARGDVGRIYSDSVPGTREGMRHLIDLNHRRIALGISDMPDSDHNDRFEAYRAALDEAGLPFDERWVVRCTPQIGGGEQLMRQLLSMTQRPTAVFITDPMVAVGAINFCHARGVPVPEQFSILGFDDADTRKLVYPEITSVCQDATLLGAEAFQMLRRFIEGEVPESRTRVLRTALSIHGSTGTAPSEVVRYLPDGSRIAEPVMSLV